MTVKFKTEAHFALQAMQKNEFLMTTAVRNPQSLKNALLNVASVGLSLNPAERQAYLVPRDGQVCLDIGYIGFVDLAVQSGALKYVAAKLVHANDTFELNGLGKEPTHTYKPFGKDRGDVVGVYCVAVTNENLYLVEAMTTEECHAIRDRTQQWKKNQAGPWKTDEGEMMKKTVIKKAAKLWPKAQKDNRLAEAFRVVNDHEGIDFEAEREAVAQQKEALRIEANAKRDAEREESQTLVNVTIKCLSADLTEGLDAKGKIAFMRDVLGVQSYDRLMYVPIEDLRALTAKLQAMKGEPNGTANKTETV